MVTDAGDTHGTFVHYFERLPKPPRHLAVFAQLHARADTVKIHTDFLG